MASKRHLGSHRLTRQQLRRISSSNRIISSNVMCIARTPWMARKSIGLVEGFFKNWANVPVSREVVINGRKIFAAMTVPNSQAIDFLGRVRQRHRRAGLVGAQGGEVQILLQPAQREIRRLVICAFDALAFQGEERSGGRSAY